MKTFFRVLTAALFLLPLFISCSSHSENSSFIARLDEVDAYIKNGDTKAAVSALKKLEKSAYPLYDRLGVYKRYVLLGDYSLAENVLKDARRTFPRNNELTAVYTKFLLNQEQINLAWFISLPLKNTEFSSLYSECELKRALLKADNSLFKRKNMVKVYEGAWRGSKNSAWLRNAVSILMERGDFKKAASLYPGLCDDENDVVFWGDVFYDAGLYKESLDCLLSDVKFENQKLLTERLCLEADDFYLLNEEEASQEIRNQIIENASASEFDEDSADAFLTGVYLNTALYAKKEGDAVRKLECLDKLFWYNPDYVPALSLYAESALEDSVKTPEDNLSADLRKAGLRTLLMEEEDLVPVVTPDEARAKIEAVRLNNSTPALEVLYRQYEDELYKKDSSVLKRANIWSFLENNSLGRNLYPPEVVDYAVSAFIKNGYEDDAMEVFYSYMNAAYGENFNIVKNKEKLPLSEVLFAAYFMIKAEKIDESLELYEFAAEKCDTRLPSAAARNSIAVNAYVNLGVIYAGTSRYAKALEVLNKASQIVLDTKTKAEILYRMAKLSDGLGDRRNALRQIEYALELDPAHKKARLFFKTL